VAQPRNPPNYVEVLANGRAKVEYQGICLETGAISTASPGWESSSNYHLPDLHWVSNTRGSNHRLTTDTPWTNGDNPDQSWSKIVVFIGIYRETSTFGTQGSQVQILPLRPDFSPVLLSPGTVIGTETFLQAAAKQRLMSTVPSAPRKP